MKSKITLLLAFLFIGLNFGFSQQDEECMTKLSIFHEYTKAKNIKLIRIGYLDMKNIEEELMKGLDSNDQLYLSTKYPIDKGWRDTTIKV